MMYHELNTSRSEDEYPQPEYEGYVISPVGDVLPPDYGEVLFEDGVSYVGDVEARQREMLTSQRAAEQSTEAGGQGANKIPAEVMDVVHEYALVVNKLYDKGASEKRLGTKAYTPMSRALALLASRRVDTSGAYQQQHDSEADAAADDRRERQIDHLMDTMGISYDEADKRVE